MEPLGGGLVRWAPPREEGGCRVRPLEEAEGFRPRTGERGCELEEGHSPDQEASQIALSDLGLSG